MLVQHANAYSADSVGEVALKARNLVDRPCSALSYSGMTGKGHPRNFALRQSGNPGHKNDGDFRPMTLRHQVFLILRCGQLVDPDPCAGVLDAELCAAVF